MRYVALAMLLFAVRGAGQESAPDTQLLRVGVYLDTDSELTPRGVDGEEWLGVFAVEDGFELRTVVLHVERYRLRAPSPEDGDPVIRLRVDAPTDPLFLLRGLADAQDGPIDMASHMGFESEGFLFPGQTVFLQPYARSQPRATLSAYGVAAPSSDRWKIRDYELELSVGESRQTLIAVPRVLPDYPVGVVWSGDIDRDGVPDLLLDAHPREVGEVYHLFLSSRAEPGDITKLVAVFTIPGC